jgi:hypothetical protein
MLDARSDLHHSVQDRRLIDVYRDWIADRNEQSRFVQVPWFGFSAFYAGLQLADYVAYLTDFISHDREHEKGKGRSRRNELHDAFSLIQRKMKIIHIP